MTRERPILFNDQMVRAILDGRKTETRRVVKAEHDPQPGMQWSECLCREIDPSDTPCEICACRFGQPPADPGDLLWVREAWSVEGPGWAMLEQHGKRPSEVAPYVGRGEWIYRATTDEPRHLRRWRPSIHMPRAAARIFLRVTSVTVERVQDITNHGAKAEGVESEVADVEYGPPDWRTPFRDLWDSVAGPGATWDANPWVWVIRFERVGAP